MKDAVDLGDIVHHKGYINMSNIYDTDTTLAFENLELLCIDCHNKEHFEKFDNEGQIKPNDKTAINLVQVYRK